MIRLKTTGEYYTYIKTYFRSEFIKIKKRPFQGNDVIQIVIPLFFRYQDSSVQIDLLHNDLRFSVAAAFLVEVRLKITDPDLRSFIDVIAKDPETAVQQLYLAFSQYDLVFRRPAGLFDRFIISRQGIKS